MDARKTRRRGPWWLVSILLGLMLGMTLGRAWAAEPRPVDPCPWPATDGLGRHLPMAGAAPAPRPGRTVGMFYFLWHTNRGGQRPGGGGPYDVAQILQADPDALRKPTSPPWGPMGLYHYWGEPLHGYYLSDDRWVLRRHARLLADAGVDVLVFDATNVETYPSSYTALGEVFAEIRAAGGTTPQFAFMVNTQAGPTARRLLDALYKPGRFRDLWFAWQGKPLLICDPAAADPEVRAFFTLRRAHWPFKMENTREAWHWEATYPQPFGFANDPTQAEQVSVSVAQNLRVADGKVTNMSSGNARGRSFHAGAVDAAAGATDRGLNFAEQWTRARELDPPFVLVTGWNEWIAGRFQRPGEPVAFVDQYDREHSRDIEPMLGGHGDAYYYQLVAEVRRFKGVAAVPPASGPQTIPLGAGPDAWAGVLPEFRDDPGDAAPRDHDGAGGTHYTNRSGRNDLATARVARDAANLHFLVQARAPLTPPTDPNWMWLLIDADQNPATGWEGFDFLVRRFDPATGTATIERSKGGWSWEPSAQVPGRVAGDRYDLIVPRSALGLKDGGPVAVDFQWADNLQHPGDPLDAYSSGDVAPEGRFRFRYAGD